MFSSFTGIRPNPSTGLAASPRVTACFAGQAGVPHAKQTAAKSLIVLNKAAGGGMEAERTEKRIRKALKELGAENSAEIAMITIPELQQRLKATPNQYDRVIAAGGDGTVTGVIQAARPFGLNVGILPLGTGNRLASLLGIPFDLKKALKVSLRGKPRLTDVMEANGRPCLLVASVGFAEEMAGRTNQHPRMKKLLGILSYPLMGLDLMLYPPMQQYRLTVNGKTYTVHAAGIGVVNGFRFGPLKAVPGAQSDDGKLDIAILAVNGKRFRAVWQLLTQQRGSFDQNNGIIHIQADDVTIESVDPANPAKVDIDGDAAGTTPLHVKMNGQVPILVPDKQ